MTYSFALAKRIHMFVLTSSICLKAMYSAIETLLKIDEKVLELLGRLVLGTGEEYATVITSVVNKINHIPVSKSVG